MSSKNQAIKTLGAAVLILLCFLIIGWLCPIQQIFGIPCPGCGMTTALYYFIQGRFQEAYFFNPAFYLLLLFCLISGLGWLRNQKFLYSKSWQLLFWLFMIMWIGIWLYRMCTIFPEWPMIYLEENLLHKLMIY